MVKGLTIYKIQTNGYITTVNYQYQWNIQINKTRTKQAIASPNNNRF